MKNQKRLIKYLLFFIFLFIADRFIGKGISWLAKQQIRDNRIGMLIENKIPSQIYIIGSSRALNNYNPAIISQITGKSCYNLGVSGSNILFHETVLDLVLMSDRKPEIIIYNVDDFGTLFHMEGVIYRKDVLFPYVDHPYINQQVSCELNRKEIATLVSHTYRQNVNFINALKYLVYGREASDYKTTNIDSLGANLLVQRPEDKVPLFGQRKYSLPTHRLYEPHLNAFRRIQEKCVKNNIKLILSLPPLYTIPSAYFRQQVKKQGIAGVHWLDFTNQMQDAGYFFNTDHMNRVGADLFSEKVGRELQKIIR
jgi:hypothetical protein